MSHSGAGLSTLGQLHSRRPQCLPWGASPEVQLVHIQAMRGQRATAQTRVERTQQNLETARRARADDEAGCPHLKEGSNPAPARGKALSGGERRKAAQRFQSYAWISVSRKK